MSTLRTLNHLVLAIAALSSTHLVSAITHEYELYFSGIIYHNHFSDLFPVDEGPAEGESVYGQFIFRFSEPDVYQDSSSTRYDAIYYDSVIFEIQLGGQGLDDRPAANAFHVSGRADSYFWGYPGQNDAIKVQPIKGSFSSDPIGIPNDYVLSDFGWDFFIPGFTYPTIPRLNNALDYLTDNPNLFSTIAIEFEKEVLDNPDGYDRSYWAVGAFEVELNEFTVSKLQHSVPDQSVSTLFAALLFAMIFTAKYNQKRGQLD